MAKHNAQPGDIYVFWSYDGKSRIIVRYDEDGLRISRDTGVIIILPRGTNVIELPFNTHEPVEES